jgi:hypothetical protein
MTATSAAAATHLLAAFEGPWRDDTPVFGCCRKTIQEAVEHADVAQIATLEPAARVRALRDVVDTHLPGHLNSHRCCVGHLADLAFDLPELLAPTSS